MNMEDTELRGLHTEARVLQHELATNIHTRLNMLEWMLWAHTVVLLVVLWKTW